jgi:P27 family predicted phage terminase small subunit
MKGRKRLPEEELKARGTKRPDRHDNRLEAEPLDELPATPEGFTAATKRVWVATCRKLLTLKILSDQDTDLIEQYCIAVITSRAAARDIEEHGFFLTNDKGNRYTNPSVAALKQSQAVIVQIADRFGFSPYARQKLKTEPKAKETKDPLAALFGKN